MVIANFQGAGVGRDFEDGLRIRLRLLQARLRYCEVDEVLIEAAVLHGRGDGEGAGDTLGQAETVTDELRATRLDGVVVGQHAVVPDLVERIQFAFDVDEAVGEGVGGGIEVAVGLDEAGLGENFAGAVLDGEVDPGLVEVALLGDVGVGDALVLDDDVGDEGFAGGDGEGDKAERGDERGAAGRLRWDDGVFFFEGEDVDVEDAFTVEAVLEEVDELLRLLVELVVGGVETVAAEPAMRDKRAVLGAGVLRVGGERLAGHVAGLAGGDGVFAVEGEGRLFCEAGALPFVVDGEGAKEFVVVERAGDGGLVAGGAEFGGLEERAHHSLFVAIEVRENFGIRDGTRYRLTLFVDEDCGHSHDVAAGAGGVRRLDGVADGAGDAFLLEGTLFGHALGEIAGEEGDGVVATLAVARELDPLLIDEHVDVLQVPGLPEAVGVNGLAPLVIGLLVAAAAVFGREDAAGIDELTVGGHGVRREEWGFLAEGVVVADGDGVVELGGGAGDVDVGGVGGRGQVGSGRRRSGCGIGRG